MAFNRLCSILFYLFITVVTCVLAHQVQSCRAGEPVWICGRRTEKNVRNRLCIVAIFCILFLLMALRFDIGNDYRQYTQTAHEAYVGGYVVTEVGFNWLVRVLYWIAGGEYYELVFAAFAFVTLLFFLKAFARQSVSFSQTFFLFMTLGLYFQTFNTVRYYLALSMALFSMKYVLEKDFIQFVFWILLASLFHKSVLLVLPMYWIATFEWKRWQIAAGLVVSAGCYLAKGLVLKLALVLYPSYKNTIYLDGGGSLTSTLR
ncbi:MAG: EpsG family protein, partial [Lachnospiraceae bacterium]|nr:EpsG family protein [Lachnospiraceae bacterium]